MNEIDKMFADSLRPYYILDSNNQVVKAKNWIELTDFDKSKKRDVGKTYLESYFISTVFLGINHASPMDTPQWFETMIFNSKEENEGDDYYCERCQTYQEALVMHENAVAFVQKKISDEKK